MVACGQKLTGLYYYQASGGAFTHSEEWDFRTDGTVTYAMGVGINNGLPPSKTPVTGKGTYTISGDTVTVNISTFTKPRIFRIDGDGLVCAMNNSRFSRKNLGQ